MALSTLSKASYFPSNNNTFVTIEMLPEKAKLFIIVLVSYQLNMVDKYLLNYYYNSAINLKTSFQIPGYMLILPNDKMRSKNDFKKRIKSLAQSFRAMLELEECSISLHQSKLLELAYTKFLWE